MGFNPEFLPHCIVLLLINVYTAAVAYVITFGPLSAEKNVCCETATDALSILFGLQDGGEEAIMVSSYETAAEAIETLRVLAAHEARAAEAAAASEAG